jgi:hypothetical protein
VTGNTIPEEIATRAHKPLIVNSRHYGHFRITARVQDSGAEQGERIVHMHDVGPVFVQYRAKVSPGLTAPDDLDGQCRFLCFGPALDLVAVSLESYDFMP